MDATNITPRMTFILNNYSLTKTPSGWRAESRYNGKVTSSYESTDRAALIARVTAQWAHFNYSDERAAFNQIFKWAGHGAPGAVVSKAGGEWQ